MRRAALVGLLLIALTTGAVAACSHGQRRNVQNRSTNGTSGTRLCELLEVPWKTLERRDLSVEDALTEPGKVGLGIRAGFAFVRAEDAPGGGRFRPALRYLSDRWYSESVDHVRDPEAPSAAVVANARELDRFLAGGGCR